MRCHKHVQKAVTFSAPLACRDTYEEWMKFKDEEGATTFEGFTYEGDLVYQNAGTDVIGTYTVRSAKTLPQANTWNPKQNFKDKYDLHVTPFGLREDHELESTQIKSPGYTAPRLGAQVGAVFAALILIPLFGIKRLFSALIEGIYAQSQETDIRKADFLLRRSINRSKNVVSKKATIGDLRQLYRERKLAGSQFAYYYKTMFFDKEKGLDKQLIPFKVALLQEMTLALVEVDIPSLLPEVTPKSAVHYIFHPEEYLDSICPDNGRLVEDIGLRQAWEELDSPTFFSALDRVTTMPLPQRVVVQ